MKPLLMLCCLCAPLQAQSLQILPAPTSSNGSGLLQIMIVSPEGSAPAALQWRITTQGGVEIEDVVVASAADTAGKSIYCAEKESARLCLAIGGMERIPNGPVAVVRFKATSGREVSAIRIGNALGATPEGSLVPLNSVELVLPEKRPATVK